METRYEIANKRAVLASTSFATVHALSDTSVFVDTHLLNISPTIAVNPRKIFSLYDSETNVVSVFTRGEDSYEPPVKIRLSTRPLASTISRQFPADVLSVVAACSSVERSFLDGVRPAHKSRSYFFFVPRYGLEKIGKNRVIWVETMASSTGQGITSCVLKRLKKLDSGAVLQIHGVGKIIKKQDSIVPYVDGGQVFNFRKDFCDNLQKVLKPFPPVLRCLMDFENSLHTLDDNYIGRDSTYGAFSTYLKEVPTSSLWSMLQLSSILGEGALLEIISMEVGQRINKLVKCGVEAVKMELVGESA